MRPARDAEMPARDAEMPARDAEMPARDAERPARDAEMPALAGKASVVQSASAHTPAGAAAGMATLTPSVHGPSLSPLPAKARTE